MILFSVFKGRIGKIYSTRRILREMALRQFKEKYAGSKLGLWWAVITPLLFAVSINFVFVAVFKIQITNYTFFVLAGMIPWFFFSNSLTEAASSFLVNSQILRQAIFPREFIPTATILANLLNFIIGLIFLLPLFIFINIKVITMLPLLAVVVILHSIFIIGFALLFSVLNVFMRDFPHILSTLFMVWFWITPVFYSIDMVPESFRQVCLSNPMTNFVMIYQMLLFQVKFPPIADIFKLMIISLVSFLIGYIIFVVNESKLLKKI